MTKMNWAANAAQFVSGYRRQATGYIGRDRTHYSRPQCGTRHDRESRVTRSNYSSQ